MIMEDHRLRYGSTVAVQMLHPGIMIRNAPVGGSMIGVEYSPRAPTRMVYNSALPRYKTRVGTRDGRRSVLFFHGGMECSEIPE